MAVPQSPLEKMQKSASFQKAMLKPRPPETVVSDGDLETVGQEELQAYEDPLRARLKARVVLKQPQTPPSPLDAAKHAAPQLCKAFSALWSSINTHTLSDNRHTRDMRAASGQRPSNTHSMLNQVRKDKLISS